MTDAAPSKRASGKKGKKRRFSDAGAPLATSTPTGYNKRVSFGGTETRPFHKKTKLDVSTASLGRAPSKSILKQRENGSPPPEGNKENKKRGKKRAKIAAAPAVDDSTMQVDGENSPPPQVEHGDSASTSADAPKRKRKLVVSKKDKEMLLTMPRQQRRTFLKELRAKRKPYYEIAKKAKVLWEIVRNTKNSKEKRDKSADDLYNLVKGRAAQLIFAHDTARVFQCLLALKRPDIRDNLFDEVRSELPRMLRSKYAKHFVTKMLKHGNESQRAEIIRSFSGRVVDLYRNADLADVVENAYNNHANARQRSDIACEFYTADHAALKEKGELITIGDVIRDDASKQMVMQRLGDLLHVVAVKPALRYSLTHRLLFEFMTHANAEQRSEMVDAVKERLVEIVHVRDGAWAALLCLAYANVKERKAIVKSTKGVVAQLCADHEGSLFLLGLLDAVDDTVLIKKTIVKEIVEALPNVMKTMSGLRVVNHLMRRRDARYLQKDQIELLRKVDESEHTKKDTNVKTHELYSAAAPHVLPYLAEHMEQLVFDKSRSLFVLNCLEVTSVGAPAEAHDLLPLCPSDGRRQCYDAIATLASADFLPANFEERLHLVEHPNAHFVLAKLLKMDKAINSYNGSLDNSADEGGKQQPLLTAALVDKLAIDQIAEWTACNKGCFILTYMLTCGETAAVPVRTMLQKSYVSKLKKSSTAGAKALLNALAVASGGYHEKVILKQIPIDGMSSAERASALGEVHLLNMLNHPNIIGYYENFIEDNMLCIVMQFAEGGTLGGYLQQRRGRYLSEDRVLMYFAQILLSLHYLHSKHILHRDLKTQNILLNRSRKIVKLSDFGISKSMKSKSRASTVIGTPCYLSPEICEGRQYNLKSDIWSLGCILYEMITLKRAFEGDNLPAIICKITKGRYEPLADHVSAELRQLVDLLLDHNEQRRPDTRQILCNQLVLGHVMRLLTDLGTLPCARSPPNAITNNNAPEGHTPASVKKLRVASTISCNSARASLRRRSSQQLLALGASPPSAADATLANMQLRGESTSCGTAVYFWGNGTAYPQQLPWPPDVTQQVSWVATDGFRHYALTSTGGVVQWAEPDEQPPAGQCSIESENGAAPFTAVSFDAPPTPIVFETTLLKTEYKIAKITCGSAFVIMITDKGLLLSMGSGGAGCLGRGGCEDAARPAIVRSLMEHSIVDAAAGSDHVLALTNTNELFAWGKPEYGRLGFKSSTKVTTPLPVSMPPDCALVRSVHCGRDASAALLCNGRLLATGANAYNQLGVHKSFVCGMTYADALPLINMNCKCGWGSPYALGATHAACIAADGGVYVIGAADQSSTELGARTLNLGKAADTAERSARALRTARPLMWPPEAGAPVAVAAGNNVTLVYTDSHRLYSFGDDSSGRLGRPVGVASAVGRQLAGRRRSSMHTNRRTEVRRGSHTLTRHKSVGLDDHAWLHNPGAAFMVDVRQVHLDGAGSPVKRSHSVDAFVASQSRIIMAGRRAAITSSSDVPAKLDVNAEGGAPGVVAGRRCVFFDVFDSCSVVAVD